MIPKKQLAGVLGGALLMAFAAASAFYLAERAGVTQDWQRILFVGPALILAGYVIRMVARHDRVFGERVTVASGITLSIAITGPIAATAIFQGDVVAGVVMIGIGLGLCLLVVFTAGRHQKMQAGLEKF